MRYPLPYAFSRTSRLLLEDDGQQLVLWHGPAPDVTALSEVLRKHKVRHLLSLDAPSLAQRISAAYAQGESSAATVVSEVESDADLSRMMQELPAVEDLLEAADDAPIIRMLNALLTQAARDGASDIHIEPYERHSSVRFRVDGTLREVVQPNRALHAALISRLKIMAELDISEKRLPQDGRISLRIGTRAVDVRVSTLPGAHGERAVLRLLDKSESKLDLESVGMQGDVLARFERLIAQPHGIILVTGPTGSGKTTTLYSVLSHMNDESVNIMTLEDPVEYPITRIRQTSISDGSKIDFSDGVRSLMRQDPDIILVGEVRDKDTAEMAFRAAMTGHQVFTTLHTNSALRSFQRIKDLGVSPEVMAGNIIGIVAQRLVRRLCPHCREAVVVTDGSVEATLIGDHAIGRTVYRAHQGGCEACGFRSYKGRLAIMELLRMDSELDELITRNASLAELTAHALKIGFAPMADDGLRRVLEGITTVEEAVRVTRQDASTDEAAA